MAQLTFGFQGSGTEPYTITVVQGQGGQVTSTCTCMSGQYGNHCYHRVDFFTGDTKKVKGSPADIRTALAWISASQLKPILDRYRAAEKQVEDAKANQKQVKAEIAEAMNG